MRANESGFGSVDTMFGIAMACVITRFLKEPRTLSNYKVAPPLLLYEPFSLSSICDYADSHTKRVARMCSNGTGGVHRRSLMSNCPQQVGD